MTEIINLEYERLWRKLAAIDWLGPAAGDRESEAISDLPILTVPSRGRPPGRPKMSEIRHMTKAAREEDHE